MFVCVHVCVCGWVGVGVQAYVHTFVHISVCNYLREMMLGAISRFFCVARLLM
jgi:ornithine cyclodeaminase/alanine dehydrogenase-like protein (mu-crystallin family)